MDISDWIIIVVNAMIIIYEMLKKSGTTILFIYHKIFFTNATYSVNT